MVSASAELPRDVQSIQDPDCGGKETIRTGDTGFNANDLRAWQWVHVILGARRKRSSKHPTLSRSEGMMEKGRLRDHSRRPVDIPSLMPRLPPLTWVMVTVEGCRRAI